ncbi:glycoside hydrolase family 11 protein [Aquisalinus flavus]|uniref:endo-1,4-beta-xylanase n=1 Tax=Aquisalinus flavus TaxID=1526572 RepID=A0A8J2V3G9_9PROT|nr:glycoside hydrolase family 11 protein [Aquisalinus flavus]MBD0425462.1 glycoside hydrolase family 11 protein [Aquisalinus flavus]UNE48901.1 hypothetical protein FF099_12995 [Aquisalinus flavus]GGD15864.1 endo-1,4-beta-xylanase A [Aquisalinus flavus]
MKRSLTRILMAVAVPMAIWLGGMSGASAQTVSACDNYNSGTVGYWYSQYHDQGTACLNMTTQYGGGYYQADWNVGSTGDFVGGKGWQSGQVNRNIGYNLGYLNSSSGRSWFGPYGWSCGTVSQNQLVEYYIIESWTGPRPDEFTIGSNAQWRGGRYIGDVWYDFYTAYRSNAPQGCNGNGDRSFSQVWSVRRYPVQQGQNTTINFATHWNEWQNYVTLYGMGYQILATEGYGGQGGSSATVWDAGN